MWLGTSASTYVQVTAIKKWTTTRRVHNLTVDDIHTYHVLAGDQALLVHNDRKPSPWDFVDSPRPDRGQTVLYALWDTREYRILKWGIHTNNNPNYSRYSAKECIEDGKRMQIIKNFDTKEEALAAERYLTKRVPGPLNGEERAGSVPTDRSWEEILGDVRRGVCD